MSALPAVILSLLASSSAAAPAPSSCEGPEYRQLDFWVGDWDAYDADDLRTVAARARVELILGGCAVHERYEGTSGLVGESFSTYDRARQVWHQTWVTNRGQLLAIEGRFEGGRLTMQGRQPSPEGRETIVRASWEKTGDGVREPAHTSADGGRTWQPLFDMVFRPHSPGGAMNLTPAGEPATVEIIKRLNQQYVDAFLRSDVGWYREHLAGDFVCIESDGTVLDREAFLRGAAAGPDVADYTLAEVRVRLFGPVALVHATGRFTRRDGTRGTSRYTDAWLLADGRWRAVSAQITRSAE